MPSGSHHEHDRLGISGRIAAFFQSAQITPLLALVALLLGVFAVLVTPREEEPQINVTMANVIVPFPGASVRDVEQMVATPAEQVLSQIAGIEHVMLGLAARAGGAHGAVQGRRAAHRGAGAPVRHGQPQRRLAAARAWASASRSSSPRASTTCPIVTLTLLRARPAHAAPSTSSAWRTALEADLKRVPGTREVHDDRRAGARGARRDRPGAHGRRAASPCADLRAGAAARPTSALPVGELLVGQPRGGARGRARILRDARDVGELVVGVRDGKPVFLQRRGRRRATGRCRPQRYVWHGIGRASARAAASSRR